MVADALSRVTQLGAMGMRSKLPHLTEFEQKVKRSYPQDEFITRLSPDGTTQYGMLHTPWGLWYRISGSNRRLYIPEGPLRIHLLKEYHEKPMASHLGVRKTIRLLAARYYWPKLHLDVHNFVVACDSCQRNKGSYITHCQGLLNPLDIPNRRW